MSNQISIIRVLNEFKKKVYPIIIFSSKSSGDRGDILRKDVISYSSIILNVEENIQGFSYYFTKWSNLE
jgi:hypothetical protein